MKRSYLASRRFFILPEQIQCPAPYLMGEEARHILQVLRLKIGDDLVLFDNTGQEYQVRIKIIEKEKIFFEKVNQKRVSRESPLQIFFGFPLIRNQAFEWILQKGTELGVAAFRPFYSARSSRNFQKEDTGSRMGRWERIITEAAKQCGRNTLPYLRTPDSFHKLLEEEPEAFRIISYEGICPGNLKDLEPRFPTAKSFFILVGPEGGFTPEEVHLAEVKGFISISLGPRILRTETASLALISLVQFLWGDMGGE